MPAYHRPEHSDRRRRLPRRVLSQGSRDGAANASVRIIPATRQSFDILTRCHGRGVQATGMGVEGKDRAKVLEAGRLRCRISSGASGAAGCARVTGCRSPTCRTQSGVAKSIISQIERNETNPTLTTIWRLAHALDASIESMLQGAEEGPFIEHLRPRDDADLRLRRRTLPARGDRLAEDRRLAAMV